MEGWEIAAIATGLLFVIAAVAAVVLFLECKNAKDDIEALQRSRLPFGWEHDSVRSPSNYEGDGEVTCERAMASMMFGADVTNSAAYWWGCALKYLWRWPFKNGAEDIDKAIECLRRLRKEADA